MFLCRLILGKYAHYWGKDLGGGFSSVQFSSVAQSCLTLCDPMNHSTPGPPVHHQLPESTQTHVHRVGDAIQSSHPLSSPSPPALNLSQHQGLFKWVSSLHQVAKVVHWRREWHTTSVFLPWEPHEQYENVEGEFLFFFFLTLCPLCLNLFCKASVLYHFSRCKCS